MVGSLLVIHTSWVGKPDLALVERFTYMGAPEGLFLAAPARLWNFHCMSDANRIAKLSAFVSSLPPPKRPPIVVPGEGFVTPEMIFKHVDPSAVPEIASVMEHLMEHHPDVLAAVGDVDRTLIWCAMERTPLENLAVAEGLNAGEEELRAALREAASGAA